MTTELTIQAADNGMLVGADDWVSVIENTHKEDGTGYDNLTYELGKIFYDEIIAAMNREIASVVRVKIEITKEE